MLDRRRHDLLHPFKLSLLRFTSQVRRRRRSVRRWRGALRQAGGIRWARRPVGKLPQQGRARPAWSLLLALAPG